MVQGPLDLRLTLGALAVGRADPCASVGPDRFRWATRTTEGPASLEVEAHWPEVGERRSDRAVVWSDGRTGRPDAGLGPSPRRQGPVTLRARAWGPGAAAVLGRLGALVAADGFPVALGGHPALDRAERLRPGARIGASGAVLQAVVPTVLGQRVTGLDNARCWRRLVTRVSSPAPGPLGLWLPPAADVLAELPTWEWHRLGVERQRSDTIRRTARVAGRLEECTAMEPAAARRRLRAVAGIGPWTEAWVAQLALGDTDAVVVGDLHLPGHVGWALAGEPDAGDERMLELLEPWVGQRARVVRLLAASTPARPRRGPRAPLVDIRRY